MRHLSEIIEDRPLVHVGMSENVSDVARRMREKNVGAVAVLDGGKLVPHRYRDGKAETWTIPDIPDEDRAGGSSASHVTESATAVYVWTNDDKAKVRAWLATIPLGPPSINVSCESSPQWNFQCCIGLVGTVGALTSTLESVPDAQKRASGDSTGRSGPWSGRF